MTDLFSQNIPVLKTQEDPNNPKRLQGIRELETVLKNSPFLSSGEKEKMKKVIPLFPTSIVEDLKQSLIRQNLRYLNKKTTT
jgi:hypothetical protein